MGGYDLSTTFHGWPFLPAPSPPPPHPTPSPPPAPKGITVQLLQLQEGNTGNPVRALQTLLNGAIHAGLVVDGVYGPQTQQAVRNYQSTQRLGVDGIAGVHTWGDLLGVPQ